MSSKQAMKSDGTSSWQVDLARSTINTYIGEGKIISPPNDLSKEFQLKAGVFVSLHKNDQLRGCIGTFMPTKKNIALEIISNAIEASTRDPRFSPVTKEELKDLDISVDVLSEPTEVKDMKELDAKKYGIIVSSGGRRGLLLPDLEGVDSPEQQIAICRQKAWIENSAPITIEKFTVTRYH